ncbi:MAG: hypothetical protein OXC99_00250 [Chloroflexi bacterium]|nr:hypothetical protein [Chloroflexota bacterium]
MNQLPRDKPIHMSIGLLTTPAMVAGLIDHPLTWKWFLQRLP